MKDDGILKAFEQDAQFKEERIPMQVTQAEAKRVGDKLREFIESRGLPQSVVAKMLAVSTSKLNQFLKGKYTAQRGVIELINKSLQLIESISRKEKRVKNKPFIETSVAKRVGALIVQTEAFSEDEGKIGLIIGDGGHGKSHCLRQYAKANKNTVYVELDDAMTATTMFAEIAKQLKIDASGSLSNITRRLIDNLQHRHIIVMLDEAAGLTVRQLNQLRQIIAVKSRCPLILAGNHDLLKTVMQPTTRRGFESLDQFTSRLCYILNLDEIASDKNGGLYTVEDIRKLYEFGGIRLVGSAVSSLRKICRSPRSGRLRTCSHIIAALHTSTPILEAGVIDQVAIVNAIEQLGLPVRVWLPVATKEVSEEQETQAVAKAG